MKSAASATKRKAAAPPLARKAGADLRNPRFPYSQFYVAHSRTSKVRGLFSLIPDANEDNRRLVKNIVWYEALKGLRVFGGVSGGIRVDGN